MLLPTLLKKTSITVNGRQYSSVEEMPADARRQYDKIMSMMTDADGNGVPDLFEGKAAGGKNINVVTVTTSNLRMNGKELGDTGDLPSQMREMIEQAQGGRVSKPLSLSRGDGLKFQLNGTMLAALVAAVAVTSLVVLVIR